MTRIATDAGGTFTDLVALDEKSGAVFVGKALTTPRDPSIGVVETIRQAVGTGLDVSDVSFFVHGGTIVINSDHDWTDARHRIEGGSADAVSIGRLFIANPDLVTRIALDAPLNYGDQRTFYSGGAQGYIDYPML
jgi:N-methylhydantoinase A/oxoprolinase/acetone carboxylase beta subunit